MNQLIIKLSTYYKCYRIHATSTNYSPSICRIGECLHDCKHVVITKHANAIEKSYEKSTLLEHRKPKQSMPFTIMIKCNFI